MKYIFYIIILNFSFNAFGQKHDFEEYNRYKELAQFNDSLGFYTQSLIYYDSMFSEFKFHPFDYYQAFLSAYKDSNFGKSNEYLVNGAYYGLDISRFSGVEISHFLSTETGKNYIAKKDSILREHFNSIDTISNKTLDSLFIKDQSNRGGDKEMFHNDSLNFNSLIQLTKERGFPTFPTTGYGCNKAWILLWHHRGNEFLNSYQWKQIIPYIEKEIEKGMLDPNFLESFYNYTEQ